MWVAGLCAVAFGGARLAAFPRNRESVGAGLVGGIAFGMSVALVWHVSTACRVW